MTSKLSPRALRKSGSSRSKLPDIRRIADLVRFLSPKPPSSLTMLFPQPTPVTLLLIGIKRTLQPIHQTMNYLGNLSKVEANGPLNQQTDNHLRQLQNLNPLRHV